MTDAPNSVDVDEEYARRFPWWLWLPEVERELFAKAEQGDDGKTLMLLKRRGKRRELFHASGICYHGNEDTCDCLVRALDSDKLTTFLKKSRWSRSALSYIADQLHRNPAYSIQGWIAVMRRRRAEANTPSAPEATNFDHTPPTKVPPADLTPSVEPASAEPPPPMAPRTRTPRWYDEFGIHDLEHYIF
jgi:hypothetical protein